MCAHKTNHPDCRSPNLGFHFTPILLEVRNFKASHVVFLHYLFSFFVLNFFDSVTFVADGSGVDQYLFFLSGVRSILNYFAIKALQLTIDDTVDFQFIVKQDAIIA